MNPLHGNPKFLGILIFLSACLGGLELPPGVLADARNLSPISVESTVSQREVTVGDIVTYSISVTHDPGIRVAAPDPLSHFKQGFEFVDRGTSESPAGMNQKKVIFWFRFRADRVGFYNFPEIPITFTAPALDHPGKTIPGISKAPKAEIVIRSVLFLDDNASDIKDIKPIIGAGPDWRKYLQWGLAGLALLLATFGIFRWIRSGEKTPGRATVPELKAHEIALAELDGLLAKKLLQQDRFREHYFELSEIFRRYLGALLSIPALDWTTEEIRDYLSGAVSVNSEWQNMILVLLPATDRVKFAKALVPPGTALHHTEAVRRFILETAPKDQPKKSTPAAA